MKKILLVTIISCVCVLSSFAQSKNPDLILNSDDLYILPGDENGPGTKGNGYHLFIRKKAGMESVMLVDSNKDPKGKQTNYAYRATKYNKINGDEIRYLNGKKLESETSKYSLIDSTTEKDSKLGEAFHIYIPETIVYGYPWARSGTINVADGLFVNIRTFSKKYGDYTGKFCDNSFNISKRKDNLSSPKTKKNKKEEKLSAETETKVIESVKKADDYVAPSTTFPLDDEPEETIAAVPFEEEYDEYYQPDYEDENEETADSSEEDSEDEADEVPGNAADMFVEGLDIPSENPFEEEDLDYLEEEEEEYVEPEPEIPEDERDPVAEKAYDEAVTDYDPLLLGYNNDPFNELDDASKGPRRPYEESMAGVDPEFAKKLEAYEDYKRQLEEAAAKKANEEPVYERPELGVRFLTHGIEFIKVEGNGKNPTLYVSRTEVAQRSYKMVMRDNPSQNQGDYLPVETVSWYDVVVFCNNLSIEDGLIPCYSIDGVRNPGAWGPVPKDKASWNVEFDEKANGYRMLTTEEWEYAANGGIYKGKGSYAGSTDADSVAWYKGNSDEMTHPVASKMQNPCGLFDMCGNVSEWCMGPSGYKDRTAAVRGGNYSYDKKLCKVSFKDACQPWYAHYENGIRICRNPD